MKYIAFAFALLVFACADSPHSPQMGVSYDVRYFGTVKGSYEIHVINPENGETVMYWGQALPYGEPWSGPEYEAMPGDTLRGAGWSDIGVEINIAVNDSVVAGTLCADSVYVEYVLP